MSAISGRMSTITPLRSFTFLLDIVPTKAGLRNAKGMYYGCFWRERSFSARGWLAGGLVYAPKVASSKTLKRSLFEYWRTAVGDVQAVILNIEY